MRNTQDSKLGADQNTTPASVRPVAGNGKLDRSEWLAVVALVAAGVTLLLFGGFLSSLFLALAASFLWTRSHREQAARGRPSFSDPGRFIGAGIMLVLAAALWPSDETKSPKEAAAEKPAPLSRSSALEPCEEAIRPQLSHPSTADFDIFDTSFTEDEHGATFTIGLTAKNSFNLELRLRAICRFEDGKLINTHVNEN